MTDKHGYMSEHSLKAHTTEQIQEAVGKAISELTGRNWAVRIETIDFGDWNTVLSAKATIKMDLTEWKGSLADEKSPSSES